MTQEECLALAQALFHEDAKYISVSRDRYIGRDTRNEFYIWNERLPGGMQIVASSSRSFDHCLAIARSGNEDIWPEDDSPTDTPAEIDGKRSA